MRGWSWTRTPPRDVRVVQPGGGIPRSESRAFTEVQIPGTAEGLISKKNTPGDFKSVI